MADPPTGARGARAAFVVLAGGSGSRVGAGLNKVYLPLGGRTVVSWSFEWARQVPDVRRFLLVVRAADAALARSTVRRELPGLAVDVVEGGASRHDSEQAALDRLATLVAAGEVDVVALHDGARPLAGPALVARVVSTAAAVGGAVPALAAEGLLAVDAAGRPTGAPGRPGAHLVRVQTPQAFGARALLEAYAVAAREGYRGTDTASTMERHSAVGVRVVAGSRQNLKVTYPHDLVLAERLLAAHGHRMP